MRRYNLLNNSLGWLCFVIAAVTYLLTLEPTASFWDCPEFILQGMKLEVGHPPGNPIFMLAARFFVNFAGGDVTKVALMVNAMSGLLSAGTILLLFWTVTHLVKRLTVKDDATEVSLTQMLVIFGSGICGALAYAWSDTFWFSAVEGEVYAFSSFCTALVFWLILKWENRADHPHSDKYLVLIAYVIGISIAVHLLNLLCIPAIVLVVYYRKWKNTTATGSLIALGLSAVIVGLILYGLVPGFVEVAQYFELFFVNTLGMSYNTGVAVYALLLVASFIWAITALYRQRSASAIRWSVLVSVLLSGILFVGSSLWIPVVLTLALAGWLFFGRELPVRILNIAVLSIFVIFIGYSSYALLLIRSSANPPMNQNAPDNVFALASYLNREQYGDRPLFYGQTYNSGVVYKADPVSGSFQPMFTDGDAEYSKLVKTDDSQKDHYVMTGHKRDYTYTPELNMLFPRIYSGPHTGAYTDWLGGKLGHPVNATIAVDENGNPYRQDTRMKPSFGENLNFFLIYQLNHMYWRYFMWNFAGRQNDIQGNGEVNHGNWISGIPFIDNPRLGDQSLLPYDEGEGNKGHNVFYMLPLLMGIFGLIWQAFHSKRGIEQFWVVFFLFFMTGIAIVIYLNQTPTQPRERDYAFAGSFYAFSIWLGMGVAALAQWIGEALAGKKATEQKSAKAARTAAIIACVAGVAVPLQMVSQTWDDHDRSGRYVARDFGMNYLNSLDPNAIIFTNGDNDTFPLWYAQEVEGCRTDVKVVNLSYLTTDWYANLMRYPTYEAPGIAMQATPDVYAYNGLQFSYFTETPDTMAVDAVSMLRHLYSPQARMNDYGVPMVSNPLVYMPVDLDKAVKDGRLTAAEAEAASPAIITNLARSGDGQGLTLGNVLSLDMIATSMANGWNRPVYFAMTVPEDYYLGLTPFLRNTGMTYEVNPVYDANAEKGAYRVDTDRAFRNITERFRWGGLDTAKPGALYLDETVRRMVTTTRTTMLDLAEALVMEGQEALDIAAEAATPAAEAAKAKTYAADRFAKARTVMQLMEEKLPENQAPYAIQMPYQMAGIYDALYASEHKEADHKKALDLLHSEIMRYGRNWVYYRSLSPRQYSTLQQTDKYIDRHYLTGLISEYQQMNGDVEKLLTELNGIGVDLNRLFETAQ